MVGAGGVPVSKDIGDDRILELIDDWTSEELLEDLPFVDGRLPGPGMTGYSVCMRSKGQDIGEGLTLQEFNYWGGGDLRQGDVGQLPAGVRRAFETWSSWFTKYERLYAEGHGPGDGQGYHADAAGRGENPYYPGLPAVPREGYKFANPTGVWKTDALAWLRSHPEEEAPVSAEQVESLCKAGAVRAYVTFEGPRHRGLEVVPPRSIEKREELIAAIRATIPEDRDPDENFWNAPVDFDWERETPENSKQLQEEFKAARRDANAKLDEEMAQNTADRSPWVVFY